MKTKQFPTHTKKKKFLVTRKNIYKIILRSEKGKKTIIIISALDLVVQLYKMQNKMTNARNIDVVFSLLKKGFKNNFPSDKLVKLSECTQDDNSLTQYDTEKIEITSTKCIPTLNYQYLKKT